jgi:hypothetical protein
MLERLRLALLDEEGAIGGDWALVLGLLTLAGALWLSQIGGVSGLNNTLGYLSVRVREIAHMGP